MLGAFLEGRPMGDALREAMYRAGLAQMAKHKADHLPLVQPSGTLTLTDADRAMLAQFKIKADE